MEYHRAWTIAQLTVGSSPGAYKPFETAQEEKEGAPEDLAGP